MALIKLSDVFHGTTAELSGTIRKLDKSFF